LTVPDALRGKTVRCPKCQVTFAAEDAPEADDEPVVVARHRTARRPPRYEPPASEDPEPEDEDDDYEERPRRKRSRRSRARDTVAAPAIALMALGLFAAFTSLGLSGYALVNVMTNEMPEPPPPEPGMTPQEARMSRRGFDVGTKIGMGGCVAVPALMALPGVLIALGANQMRTLGSYGFAMTAAFLAVLPCQPCCVLGLPFGVWALVTLNDEEIKDAFA
jgi:hypothetical protein